MEVITDQIKLSVTKQEYDNYHDNWNDTIDGFGHKWYVEQLEIDNSKNPLKSQYFVTLRKCTP